jgi:hypothetical protein
MSLNRVTRSREDQVIALDEKIAELSLLLPGREAAKLERIAASRGLTVAGLIRRLIQDYLDGRSGPRRIKR